MDGVFMMKFLLSAVLWMLIGAVLFGVSIPEPLDITCMTESAEVGLKLDSVASYFIKAFGECPSVESLMKPARDQLTEKLDKLENFFGSRE